jgi:hypothetical protein
VQIFGHIKSGKHDQVVAGTTLESMGVVLFAASVTMAFGDSDSVRLLATALPVQSPRRTLVFWLITLALRCVTEPGGALQAQESQDIVLSTSLLIYTERRLNGLA